LTVWSGTRYYAIQRCELIDCAWEKPRLRYRAPNVVALTQHYNRLSQWVEYQILTEKNLKARITKMEKLIDLCQALFSDFNFYDAMGILSGFDANSCFRLNAHVAKLNPAYKEKLDAIRDQCLPTGNFKELRNQYEKALNAAKPVLPYIGVLLSDLFKYYDATQTFVNGLINVRKTRGVYKMIAKIEEFAGTKYAYRPIDQVQQKIDDLGDFDEDDLMKWSMEIEKDDGTLLDVPLPSGPQ
jgi:hypothetical protein